MMSTAALVPLRLVVVRRAAVVGAAGAAQQQRGLGVHIWVEIGHQDALRTY